MANNDVINIDAWLQPSRFKRWVWGLGGVGFGLMLAPLALSFHYQLLVAVLAAVLMWFGQIFSHHLIACATLTQHQASQRPYGASNRTAERYQFLSWQLQLVQGRFLIPWQQKQDIWHATLLTVSDVGVAVILQFAISQPLPKTIKIMVWQDQVDQENWRQLKILAR